MQALGSQRQLVSSLCGLKEKGAARTWAGMTAGSREDEAVHALFHAMQVQHDRRNQGIIEGVHSMSLIWELCVYVCNYASVHV